MDKRNPGDPMMLLWPWWQPSEAGRGKPTDPTGTKSSPRSVPALPLEIIDITLRELRDACTHPLWGEDLWALTACALVCKSWLPIARRLLYRSVTVETGLAEASRVPRRFGPEALLQRSHLLGFTRSLSILMHGKPLATLPLSFEDDSPKEGRECVRIPDFVLPLAHTPQLQYLGFTACWPEKGIGQFEPHILNWLSSLVLPVEVLDIADGDGASIHSTVVYDLVGIWPTIRALRVSTGVHGPPPERASIRLRELRIYVVHSNTALAFIEWFLPPPPPNEQPILRFLWLEHIPEAVRGVLSVHGPSVSALELIQQPRFEIDHLFTNLEELVIRGLSWSSPLPALPRTLKHIRLVCGLVPVGMSLDNVVVAVTQVVPVLPDLCIISIDEKLTASERYPDLQEACETHGVEVLVSPPLFSTRRPVHPYHAEMTRFPRQYTFSEFFDAGDQRH